VEYDVDVVGEGFFGSGGEGCGTYGGRGVWVCLVGKGVGSP
jgi:hypothetical protein